MTGGIDQELDRLDGELATAERQAKAVLGNLRGLRKQVAKGALAGLTRRLEQLPGSAGPLTAALETAGGCFGYDAATAFADGAYVRELQNEAARQGMVLVERDGRLTAFPLLLKLEPGTPAVRVGRRLEREIRPAALIAHLKKAQQGSVFNAEQFLETLFRAATHLAGARPDDDAPRAGAVVPLADIYDLLTLRPGTAAEYPREAFAVDLLRLDRAPDTTTKRGYRFTLPASTGSKGRSRLTVYDERGAELVFIGIAFSRDG